MNYESFFCLSHNNKRSLEWIFTVTIVGIIYFLRQHKSSIRHLGAEGKTEKVCEAEKTKKKYHWMRKTWKFRKKEMLYHSAESEKNHEL